jgi:hypothetical protein
MSQIYSIACGLPFCQSTKGEQTTLSIGLRVTAVALGSIAVIGGILILCGIPGINQFGNTVVWITFSTGGSLIIIGASVKCIKHEINENNSLNNPTAEHSNSQAIIDATETIIDEEHSIIDEEHSISERELQEGITISDETIQKIQTNMKNILQKNENGEVKIYETVSSHRVFTLDTEPDLIFKMWSNKCFGTNMQARYKTMVKAKTVCRTHQLGLLIIPNAKLFTVTVDKQEHEIIAERKLDINPDETAQEQYYEEFGESLDEAIHQLAIFICKTGYSDVEWRNNPVLNNSLDEGGNRKFALIDTEEMDSAEVGLFGTDEKLLGSKVRRGLVKCVNEQQGLIVKKIAEENGIDHSFCETALILREKELEDGKQLKAYYSKRNVTHGDKAIEGDVQSIDFSPSPPKEVETLQELAGHLLNDINHKIKSSPSEASVKGRRNVFISFHDDEKYNKYGNNLLQSVFNKFLELGFIYSANENDYGYSIQA